MDQPADGLQIPIAHAKLGKSVKASGLVQQTQDDPFAMTGGKGAYAQIDGLVSDHNGGAAVLGDPLLGDVHPAHNLDPADYLLKQKTGRLHEVVEHPVDAQPYLQSVLEGLNVNVAGPPLDRLEEDQVDEPGDGRGAVGVQKIVGTAAEPAEQFRTVLVPQSLDNGLDAAFLEAVSLVDRPHESRLIYQNRCGGQTQQHGDFVQGVD